MRLDFLDEGVRLLAENVRLKAREKLARDHTTCVRTAESNRR
jgi:hypothetical protein